MKILKIQWRNVFAALFMVIFFAGLLFDDHRNSQSRRLEEIRNAKLADKIANNEQLTSDEFISYLFRWKDINRMADEIKKKKKLRPLAEKIINEAPLSPEEIEECIKERAIVSGLVREIKKEKSPEAIRSP